jgi:two-component sensor histidine kinase
VVIKQHEEHGKPIENYEGIMWSMDCDLHADDIKRANPVEEIMSILGAQTLMRPNRDVIGLLLAELYSNALEHGILDLSSELKKTEEGFMEYYQQRQVRLEQLSDATISVSFKLVHEDEMILRIKMKDSGKGFDYQHMDLSKNEGSFGRGVSLINRVCKRVAYCDGGTCVEVDFPVSKSVVID